MDIIHAYLDRHFGCVIVINGLPIKWSNHHILGESLASVLKTKIPDVETKYQKVLGLDDFKIVKDLVSFDSKKDPIIIIISSDIILGNIVEADFDIFIDTPMTVLATRGMEDVIRDNDWDILKQTRFNAFVNDYSKKTVTKIDDVLSDTSASWKTFMSLWATIMRVIHERMHRENVNKEVILTREDRGS